VATFAERGARRTADGLRRRRKLVCAGAACAVSAFRRFAFWRDRRYKPCRSARRCVGDQGFCLQSRCWDIPYDVGLAAHNRMIAELPPDADSFLLTAHYRPPTSLCLHNPKNQKTRTKGSDKSKAKMLANTEAGPRS
jgi:hypothetical protein